MVGSIRLDEEPYVYQVKSLIPHENYNPFEFANDIAIMVLKESIEFNEVVQPIELNEDDSIDGENVTLQGWGSTEVGGITPNILQCIDLKILDQATCQEKIGMSGAHRNLSWEKGRVSSLYLYIGVDYLMIHIDSII